MADTDPPWEPPLAGTEAEALAGALDRLRATFRWKVDGLDSAGLTATIPSSTLTLGGLLKHLALVEDYQSTVKMTGEPMGEPWASMGMDEDDPDWEFTSAADDSPEELYALYDGAVRPLPRAVRRRAGERRSRRAGRGRTAVRATFAGWSATCSRSTAGTPATPTCCARRWTAGAGRTRTRAGCLPSDSGKPGAADKVTLTSPRLGESP